MDRRTFIGGVAGGLLLVPIVVRAQQPGMPVVGFLSTTGAEAPNVKAQAVAFLQGLKQAGYVEGQNSSTCSKS
jgi:hypothetical protein